MAHAYTYLAYLHMPATSDVLPYKLMHINSCILRLLGGLLQLLSPGAGASCGCPSPAHQMMHYQLQGTCVVCAHTHKNTHTHTYLETSMPSTTASLSNSWMMCFSACSVSAIARLFCCGRTHMHSCQQALGMHMRMRTATVSNMRGTDLFMITSELCKSQQSVEAAPRP
jgi:hypothetical protein